MKLRRFRADDLAGTTVRIVGREAFHALHVVRLRKGNHVVLFDGHGREALGVIRSAGKDWFVVDLAECSPSSPAARPGLILAVAPPKGERADWLVEKCAELGTSEMWPLRLRRSAVVPGDAKIARWRRKAVQAAKQAGQAAAMTVEPLRSLAEVLEALPRDTRIWLADPERSRPLLAASLTNLPPGKPRARPDLAFVGPEGGFADDERAAILAAGGQTVRLCDFVLRVETAAVVIASLWATWMAAHPRSDAESAP